MFWFAGMEEPQAAIYKAHEDAVWDVAWHPMGHILGSGSKDNWIKFWVRNRPGDEMIDRYSKLEVPKSIFAPDAQHHSTNPSGMNVSACWCEGSNRWRCRLILSAARPRSALGQRREDAVHPRSRWLESTRRRFLQRRRRLVGCTPGRRWSEHPPRCAWWLLSGAAAATSGPTPDATAATNARSIVGRAATSAGAAAPHVPSGCAAATTGRPTTAVPPPAVQWRTGATTATTTRTRGRPDVRPLPIERSRAPHAARTRFASLQLTPAAAPCWC